MRICKISTFRGEFVLPHSPNSWIKAANFTNMHQIHRPSYTFSSNFQRWHLNQGVWPEKPLSTGWFSQERRSFWAHRNYGVHLNPIVYGFECGLSAQKLSKVIQFDQSHFRSRKVWAEALSVWDGMVTTTSSTHHSLGSGTILSNICQIIKRSVKFDKFIRKASRSGTSQNTGKWHIRTKKCNRNTWIFQFSIYSSQVEVQTQMFVWSDFPDQNYLWSDLPDGN